MSVVSFGLAVVFIIRLFSTSAFRVPILCTPFNFTKINIMELEEITPKCSVISNLFKQAAHVQGTQLDIM